MGFRIFAESGVPILRQVSLSSEFGAYHKVSVCFRHYQSQVYLQHSQRRLSK